MGGTEQTLCSSLGKEILYWKMMYTGSFTITMAKDWSTGCAAVMWVPGYDL